LDSLMCDSWTAERLHSANAQRNGLEFPGDVTAERLLEGIEDAGGGTGGWRTRERRCTPAIRCNLDDDYDPWRDYACPCPPLPENCVRLTAALESRAQLQSDLLFVLSITRTGFHFFLRPRCLRIVGPADSATWQSVSMLQLSPANDRFLVAHRLMQRKIKFKC
jgi:hypothetical protein